MFFFISLSEEVDELNKKYKLTNNVDKFINDVDRNKITLIFSLFLTNSYNLLKNHQEKYIIQNLKEKHVKDKSIEWSLYNIILNLKIGV